MWLFDSAHSMIKKRMKNNRDEIAMFPSMIF